MKKCCVCQSEARAEGQRYCLEHHAEAQKKYREAHPTLTVARSKTLHVERSAEDRRRRGTKL